MRSVTVKAESSKLCAGVLSIHSIVYEFNLATIHFILLTVEGIP
ncbi:hypothetical protein NUACC26_023830 [Scytonema sp. NUACC26]